MVESSFDVRRMWGVRISVPAAIVSWRFLPARAPAESLGARLAQAFGKYHALGYSPAADAWAGEGGGGLRVLVPRQALAWFSFPGDATRFTFAPAG